MTKTITLSLLATLAIVGCDKKDEHRPRAEEPTLGQAIDRAGERVERTGEQAARDIDRAGVEASNQARETTNNAVRELGFGPTTQDFSRALSTLAEARCQREVRCHNVGSSKRWSSESACRTAVEQGLARDLNAQSCSAGLDQEALNECMRDVRTESCESPLDTLGRLASCRTTGLCRNVRAVSMR